MGSPCLNAFKIGMTGYDGFIGRHLAVALREAGAQVFPVLGDVRSTETWNCEFDLLYHLAAVMPSRFADEPKTGFSVNVGGTLEALEACRIQRGRMVFFSTCGVYCPSVTGAIPENSPINPQTLYAQSKSLAETLCRTYATHFGIPTAILRIFNVYGTGQNPAFLIPYLVRSALMNTEAVVNNPDSSRDFIHVSDVVRACLNIARWQGDFDIFNVGSGVCCTIRELLAKIERILTRPVAWRQSHTHPDSQPIVCADLDWTMGELGWFPQVDLEQGLRELIGTMNDL